MPDSTRNPIHLVPHSAVRGTGEALVEVPSFAEVLSPHGNPHPAKQLEAFRAIATTAGYLPILLELAVIDDVQMEAAIEGVLSSEDDSTKPASFVSTVGCYVPHLAIVDAWHASIGAVLTSEFKHSIVAWPGTYSWGELSDPGEANAPLSTADAERLCAARKLLEDQLATLEDAGVSRESIEIVEATAPQSSTSSPLGFAYRHRYGFSFSDAATKVLLGQSQGDHETAGAVQTLSYAFQEQVGQLDLPSEISALLSRSILVVVPFVRPTEVAPLDLLLSRDDKTRNDPLESHPGGCLFAILVPPQVPEDLDARQVMTLRFSATLTRAALREARLRTSIAESHHLELATLEHAVLHPCEELSAYLSLLEWTIDEQRLQNSDIADQLAAVRGGVERLRRAADIGVSAFKGRVAGAPSRPLAEEAAGGEELSKELKRVLDECAQSAAWVGVTTSSPDRDQIIRQRVDIVTRTEVTYEAIPGPLSYSAEYLTHVFTELLRNIFRRWAPEGELSIHLQPAATRGFTQLVVSNSAAPRQSTGSSGLRLGLHQMEVAAMLYDLPTPVFDPSNSEKFTTTLFIAKQLSDKKPED